MISQSLEVVPVNFPDHLISEAHQGLQHWAAPGLARVLGAETAEEANHGHLQPLRLHTGQLTLGTPGGYPESQDETKTDT